MININFQREIETKGSGDTAESAEQIAIRQNIESQLRVVSDIRLRVDSLFLTTKAMPPSRHISLAITEFQRARQFCGIIKRELGADNPYPQSMNKDSKEVVAERPEKGTVIEEVVKLPDEVAQLKQMRSIAEDLVTDISVFMENNKYSSVRDFVARNEVLAGVMSGKMWLGERLGEFAEVPKAEKK